MCCSGIRLISTSEGLTTVRPEGFEPDIHSFSPDQLLSMATDITDLLLEEAGKCTQRLLHLIKWIKLKIGVKIF